MSFLYLSQSRLYVSFRVVQILQLSFSRSESVRYTREPVRGFTTDSSQFTFTRDPDITDMVLKQPRQGAHPHDSTQAPDLIGVDEFGVLLLLFVIMDAFIHDSLQFRTSSLKMVWKRSKTNIEWVLNGPHRRRRSGRCQRWCLTEFDQYVGRRSSSSARTLAKSISMRLSTEFAFLHH